jgi:hypothetical protein
MIVGSDRVGHAIDVKRFVTHVGVSKAAYCDNASSTVTHVAPVMLVLVEYEVRSGITIRRVLLYSRQGDSIKENNMTSSQQHFLLVTRYRPS